MPAALYQKIDILISGDNTCCVVMLRQYDHSINMASQGRRWCFTLNNYSELDIAVLKDISVKSIIVGKEVGESGTPHLQGFIKFNTAKRLIAVKKILDKAHWETAKGSDDHNLVYCSKDNEVIIKKGIFSSGEKGGGANTLKLALSIADKNYNDMDLDEKCAYLMHEKSVTRHKQLTQNYNDLQQRKEFYKDATLRPWQQELMTYIEGDVDNRKVKWYVDTVGNTGKSWIADYIRTNKNGIKFENGKSADIAYIYRNEPIVMFDLSRSQEQFFNYSIIENFKNGYLYSPKYESCIKNFTKPHVIVFSNFDPDRSKLSADRWDVVRLFNIN